MIAYEKMSPEALERHAKGYEAEAKKLRREAHAAIVADFGRYLDLDRQATRAINLATLARGYLFKRGAPSLVEMHGSAMTVGAS